ncbi:hypothetical protein RvVAR0630_17830 [Agrobacterium vitis]|uniref:DUF6804 family protein n=1 Tax=Rhizobium/Agrobacterium group TaxID=227290 RepID=UPI0015D755CA|nr:MULTISPECIES: DUF6804 family protein [Rhizobium/Agrobacterium group]MCF1471162.1 hypothetical protein [Allorhizobium ampelinum]BCH59159.1 hypothetical protein RvVAR0630_17830 [Agrobacterium vitis]
MTPRDYAKFGTGIAALLLFAALAPWSYGFYSLLRLVVCAAALYAGIQLLERDRNISIGLFVVAFIFNPLLPLHLTREIWSVLNVAAGVFMGYVTVKLARQ